MFGLFRKVPRKKIDFVIVGLGNPGVEYEGTRHNVGFEILLEFARQGEFPIFKKLGNALVSEKAISEGHVLLVLPQTFMNLSGEIFEKLNKKYDYELPACLLVVHDDMDLPLGVIRYRAKGSSGGHNGLKSIEACLGTQEYNRIKFGIGRNEIGVIDHVLGKWNEEERNVLSGRINEAVQSLFFWLRNLDKRELINSSYNRN